MIPIVYPRCAGLDVHKKFVVACRLSVDGQGKARQELRKFGTMTGELQELAVWLVEGGVTHVAMESTGVYWQPIYHILEEHFEIFLVNAQAVKRMPGRKTDMKDAEWLATLLQHGLLQPSFIPPREQRELRDLTRYRTSLMQERARFTNRLQKVLEDANLKLSSVATDLQGVTAQAILRALVAGQEDPKLLAELARGTLRKKRGELERAMVGRMTQHHRFLLAQLLAQVDFLDEQIALLDERMQALLAEQPPFEEAVGLLDTIPGVNRQLAILIVSEMGVDMSRFPTDRHLTAWAGVAPGNNETGGKQRSGRARKGNRHLTTGLVLGAHAASHQKNTYLRALFYRLAARRGKQRAAVAVGRTILQMAYYMLKRHEGYRELGAGYLDQLDRERTAKRLVKRLVALGYEVKVLEPKALHEEDMERKSTDPPLPLAA